MADQHLAFRITANASGMNAGIAQAERNLQRVSVSAAATSKELAQAARITESVKTPAEKYAQKVEKLDKFLSKGIITQETYSRAVAKAEKDMRSAEQAANGTSSAVERMGESVEAAASKADSVEALVGRIKEAASDTMKWASSMAAAYGQWKLWSALQSPKAFGEFAMSGIKVVATARNAVTALKLFGVGLGIAGGTTGVLSTAVLGLTNPMVGLGLAAINVARQFFASRDAAYETAKAVSELRLQAATTGESFQNLNIQKALDAGVAREDLIAMGVAIAAIDVGHFDSLADAMERSEQASKRLETAEAGVTKTIGGAFVGLLEGISNGMAGLTNGLADLTAGANTLLTPIAQVLRPVGTLLGTLVDGALRTVGVLGSLAGSVLRVAGLVASVFLSPFIVGLNNTADAIKGGLGAAFDWVSKKIAAFNSLLDTAYNYLSKMPVIGSVFASNEGGIVKAAEGAAVAGGEGGAAAAAADIDETTGAINRQEESLSKAIMRSQQYGEAGMQAAIKYQDSLRNLEAEFEAGMFNEATFAQEADKLRKAFEDQVDAIDARTEAARRMAEEDAANEAANVAAMSKQTDAFFKAAEAAQQFGAAGAAAAAEYEGGLTSLNEKLKDGRINQTTYADEAEKLRDKFKGQVDQMKAVAAAQKKRADDVQRMQDRITDAGEFQREAEAALAKGSSESLQVADVRSAEGMKSFMALATGREDPAIAEYRKSHETLQKMLGELRALQAAPLEIAGAAGG